MKRKPKIEVYWDNPPTKKSGITVERSIAGGIYSRHVPPAGLLSSTEAAEVIGITLRHLYNLVNDNKLKSVQKSGRLFFRLSKIKRYVAKERPRSGKAVPWLAG